MNGAIFRKVALERLSSPERLDDMLRVAGPRSWIALIGIGIVLSFFTVWGYTSGIATVVDGQGIIVRAGGVSTVVSQSSGLILSLDADVGQHISANQVIARVAQPELEQQIRAAREELADSQRMYRQSLDMQGEASKLQIGALQRRKQNLEESIDVSMAEKKLLTDQLSAAEKLLARGLITQTQTIQLREKMTGVDAQINAARAEIKAVEADQYNAETSPARASSELEFRVAEAGRKLTALQVDLRLTTVVRSPYSGEVVEVKQHAGSPVISGTPLVSIQPDSHNMHALLYLPSVQAKNVQPGMEAEISPTNVVREEYGFMRGKVSFVADYPATEAALMRNFANDALVKSLLASGPVTEVRVALDRDLSAPSGYRWSSSKGPDAPITSGTICGARVVTRMRKPITLVVPALRGKFGLQ